MHCFIFSFRSFAIKRQDPVFVENRKDHTLKVLHKPFSGTRPPLPRGSIGLASKRILFESHDCPRLQILYEAERVHLRSPTLSSEGSYPKWEILEISNLLRCSLWSFTVSQKTGSRGLLPFSFLRGSVGLKVKMRDVFVFREIPHWCLRKPLYVLSKNCPSLMSVEPPCMLRRRSSVVIFCTPMRLNWTCWGLRKFICLQKAGRWVYGDRRLEICLYCNCLNFVYESFFWLEFRGLAVPGKVTAVSSCWKFGREVKCLYNFHPV